MTYRFPVAITGMGCLCAAGGSLPEAMRAIFRGERRPASPARFSSTHGVSHPVFEVSATLAGGDGISRTARLALTAAGQALADAGLTREKLAGRKVGVCLGTTVGSALNNEEFYRGFRAGLHPSMAAIERYLGGNPAAALAREFGLDGPCQTVVNACSSGTDAVGIGADWIRAGLCDAVLAGGADELGRVTYNGFISLMITDAQPLRPFDRRRRGLNLGEGAAILVLESEKLRRQRDRSARSFVVGYASSCDAHHLTAPEPQGRMLERAILEALAAGGLRPAAVAFVNAHGTGTPDNDRVESRVLAKTLPGVPFYSSKGYTGHTLGAAGAIEAAFTVCCLEQGQIPASAGFAEPDPELPAAPVRRTTEIGAGIGLSQSLAFGGSNAVLVLARGDQA